MEALVLERKDELNLRSIEIPEELGPHDVRIAIHTVGICGSDVHYYTHGAIGQFVVRECLQGDASPENLAQDLVNFLDDGAICRRISGRFAALHEELRQGNAMRAADAVCTLLRA